VTTELVTTARVGVLMGGPSSERAVSLETGGGVLAALQRRGYDVVGVDWRAGESPIDALAAAGVQVVWNALHGTRGEDGAVQGLLECVGLPYTGSRILASALAMDKVMSKRIFDACGLPTAPWSTAAAGDAAALREVLAGWEAPFVIKPSCEGSSVGVIIVRTEAERDDAIEAAAALRGALLIERYIAGAEVAVGILDGRVLGSVEIRPAVAFYDYEAKYHREDTQYFVPPRLDADVVARCEREALAAHVALGCEGYSRVDSMVIADGASQLLEVNTLPGMTSHSLLPKIAAAVAIDYDELCVRILRTAR
jgi:D-alanine-D-alanine ligase